MEKPHRIALVGGGQVSRSFLVRLPRVRAELGPVKASSNRLASRIVNAMRAGYPAQRYEELSRSRVVLVHVPGEGLDGTITEMEKARMDWRGKVVLLCDPLRSSTALAPLARRGAFTGSLAPIEGFEERTVLVEGDGRAVRAAKRLVQDEKTKVIEILHGSKDLFLAGLVFATSLLTPMAAAGVECLKRTGLKSGPASDIIERLLEKSLRSFVKAGRKSWGGPMASRDEDQVRRHLEALFRVSPLLASFYTENALFALQLFRRETDWLPAARGPERAGPGQEGPKPQ